MPVMGNSAPMAVSARGNSFKTLQEGLSALLSGNFLFFFPLGYPENIPQKGLFTIKINCFQL